MLLNEANEIHLNFNKYENGKLLYVISDSIYAVLQIIYLGDRVTALPMSRPIVRSRSRRIDSLIHRIALKFHRHIGSSAIVYTNLASLRLYKLMQ